MTATTVLRRLCTAIALTGLAAGSALAQRPTAPATGPRCDIWDSTYNTNNVCFDIRPRPTVATVLPVPDSIPGSPTAPVLRVWVTAEGAVTQVVAAQNSSVPRFTLFAINFVKAIKFNPAQKSAKPVAAWTMVRIQPSGR